MFHEGCEIQPFKASKKPKKYGRTTNSTNNRLYGTIQKNAGFVVLIAVAVNSFIFCNKTPHGPLRVK
jgi:hypothetical protein